MLSVVVIHTCVECCLEDVFMLTNWNFSVVRFVQKEMRRTEQYSKRYKKLLVTLGTLQKYAASLWDCLSCIYVL